MSVRQVLKEALAVTTRAHSTTQLATDAHGVKVRPLDSRAVAWSSTGALIKVAPSGQSTPGMVQHTEDAWQAYLLLGDAATEQGYEHVAAVDTAGCAAAQRMFWRALQLVDPAPRRRTRATTGSTPRGAAA